MNPLATLTAHRPTDGDLLQAWPVAARERAWTAVQAQLTSAPSISGKTGQRPRRRWLAAGAAAAALALTISLAPALLSPDDATSAQAVQQLVTSAQRSTAQVIPAGAFLHMIITDHQTSTMPGQPNTSSIQESWTASDGRVWRKDVRAGETAYYEFPAWPDAAPLDITPAGTAAMPTNQEALLQYLDSRVRGSSSRHEAIFVAIGDMTRQGFVPPGVRAASIKVAAGLPEVTATRDGSTTVLSFADDTIRAGIVQSLIFDSDTAALIGERTTATQHDFVYTSTIKITGIVDTIPTAITANAVTQDQTDDWDQPRK